MDLVVDVGVDVDVVVDVGADVVWADVVGPRRTYTSASAQTTPTTTTTPTTKESE